MRRRPFRWLAACLAIAAITGACGKKGNPLAPLRPVPARIIDLTAARTTGRVELKFSVPSANLDGTTPVLIDRIDIFRMVATPDVPPPPAGQVAADPGNLRASLPVRRPVPVDTAPPATPTSTLVPLPGEVATFADDIADLEQSGATAVYYVAVPVVGTGRGRPGPPTPVANVPLGLVPAAPAEIVLTHDEANVRVNWKPVAANQVFRVFRVSADRTAPPVLLTPEPLAGAEFAVPVVFGAELCLSVRPVQAIGPVSIEGAASAPACLTPADRYPPPVPSGVRVVQEGQTVTVIWEAVDAADLAGYVVLRGGVDPTMVPLMRDPMRETTFRDTTVQAGATYTYAVYAQDSVTPPNSSALSARETITVR